MDRWAEDRGVTSPSSLPWLSPTWAGWHTSSGQDPRASTGPESHHEHSTGSNPSLEEDEDEEDPLSDSVSQYSDAHSTFEIPMNTRAILVASPPPIDYPAPARRTGCAAEDEDAMPSCAAKPTSLSQGLNKGYADIGSMSGTPNAEVRDNGSAPGQHRPVLFPSRTGSSAAAGSRRVSIAPSMSSDGRLSTLSFATCDLPRSSTSSDTADGPDESTVVMSSLLSQPLRGQGRGNGPDWSTAANPWAVLEASIHPDEQQTLKDENNRLRAELEALKAASAHSGASPIPTPPGSPERQPSLVAPSRGASYSTTTPPDSPAQRPVAEAKPQGAKKPALSSKGRLDVASLHTITLRDLILKRVFAPHVVAGASVSQDEVGSTLPLTLDSPLTPGQVAEFSNTMDDVLLSGRDFKQPITMCAVCHLPKFKDAKESNRGSYVSEVLGRFPAVLSSAFADYDPLWGLSPCCRRHVCKTCLRNAIVTGISTQWWFDLNQSTWLKCPVPLCGRNLRIEYTADLVEMLQTLGVSDVPGHVKRFETASQLRSALQTLSPLPNKDQLRRSKVLHDRLVRYGRMRPLLNDAQLDLAEITKPELLPVDTSKGRNATVVPVFTQFLRRRKEETTCVVCFDTHREFDEGDQQRWERAKSGFGGDWTWRVQSFPTSEVLPECAHAFEICRDCLATHVATQLQVHGYGAVGNISCATPECEHKYTHEEVRRLARDDVFAKYDRYATINSVKDLAKFRWCLREGCDAGGLYDSEPDEDKTGPARPAGVRTEDPKHIMCSECGFDMCYACQTPWHAGLSCAQYNSQRDPSYSRTQVWLARHTKPCPGCGVQLLKGEGCFHMTCSKCRFEFCWECLADWRNIQFKVGRGPGAELRHRSSAHREGCYFRRAGSKLPTQVLGRTLETGLRQLADVDAAE